MTQRTDYTSEAKSDAVYMAEHFLDEIVEKLCDDGKASDDILNDYSGGDSYHHESHVDKAYSLLEAAELLDELDDYEETDSGLWEGLEPRRAVEAQAAYTYGNAVYSMFRDIIEEINDDSDIEEFHAEYLDADDEAQPAPDPSAWTPEQCMSWLDDRDIDPSDIAIADDDVDAWRQRVRDESESAGLPKRSRDEIKEDVSAWVRQCIENAR